jgi:hypothetical protein
MSLKIEKTAKKRKDYIFNDIDEFKYLFVRSAINQNSS